MKRKSEKKNRQKERQSYRINLPTVQLSIFYGLISFENQSKYRSFSVIYFSS